MYKMYRTQCKAKSTGQCSYENTETDSTHSITTSVTNHMRGGQGWGWTTKVYSLLDPSKIFLALQPVHSIFLILPYPVNIHVPESLLGQNLGEIMLYK